MSSIRVENLRKEFNHGAVVAVRDLNITFEEGTTTCLLGPSGCGKTTLMRIIAGLEQPTGGDVFFGDERVTHLSTRKRNIGMVFQYPVIYRGASVRRNIELPLLEEKISKVERERRVDEVIHLLDLTDSLDLPVDRLDNGSRQKVAMARAVARHPRIILFDEPITNVDINAKLQLKRALKSLVTRLNQTIIYVTHDQTEAMTLADKIALMKDGDIVQYDAPRDLYNKPDDVFGGWFLGNPGMNFFENLLQHQVNPQNINIPLFSKPIALRGANGNLQSLIFGIRPEHLQVYTEPTTGGFPCEIMDKGIVTGGQYLVTLKLNGYTFKAKVPAKTGQSLQNTAWVKIPVEQLRLFEANGALSTAQIAIL